MDRFLGRYSVVDGVHRRVTTDEARKTRVASFPGEHYSAEHEDGMLHVYSHTDELGRPARKFGNEEGSSGIRSSAGSGLDTAGGVGGIGSIADLNALHLKYHEGVGRIMRRRA
jgi:hypothetical protein